MDDQQTIDRLKQSPEYLALRERYTDRNWRLDNLYKIVSETGAAIPFKRNEAQYSYGRRRHSRDLIPKARKLGFSTFIGIQTLDYCMFRENITAGIVDARMDDGKKKLASILFSYRSMPEHLQAANPLAVENTEELRWENGSSITVGTSYRGGTPQILHISEYGRVSVDKPDQARAIKMGSMQAVPATGWCVVESTPAGKAGEFYDLVKAAERLELEGKPLNALSWRLHFYGWWLKREYRLPNNLVVIPHDLREYFAKLAPILKLRHNVVLDADQMAFYTQKRFDLGPDDCFEEFPSVIEECFFNSILGAYWGKEINKARAEKRIGFPVPHDPTRRVNTWWDIGEDCTSITFVQEDGVRCRVIDYWEDEGASLQAAAGVLDEKRRERGFIYAKHIGPHDIANRDWANAAFTRYETALGLGIKFEIVPRIEHKPDSIEAARRKLATIYVDEEHAKLVVERWENYRKKWNKALQVFSADPVHDIASHASDGLQQGAMYKDDGKDGKPTDRHRAKPERKTSAWAS